MQNSAIKITILGGFLGSGKTTILNKIIRNLPEGQRTAILINDFGDVSIDSLIIEKGNYSKKEIKGGCICCSLKEKLLQNLLDIVNDEDVDNIYIEATGLAVPWEMKKSIEKNFNPEKLLVEKVLVCTDALQFERYHDYLPVYSRQYEGEPFVLITKADIHKPDLLKKIREKLQQHYPGISGFSESINGRWSAPPKASRKDEIFQKGMMSFLLQTEMIDTGKDGIEQLTFQGDLKVSQEEMNSLISENREKIIRLKALLPIENSLKNIQFDGNILSENSIDIEDSGILSEALLTLFCMKENSDNLKKIFTQIIAN